MTMTLPAPTLAQNLKPGIATMPDNALAKAYDDWRATPDGEQVFDYCARVARNMYGSGFDHYGIAAIFEVARYDYFVAVGPDATGFKLNNNHRAYLARELMAAYPELEGFFAVREVAA